MSEKWDEVELVPPFLAALRFNYSRHFFLTGINTARGTRAMLVGV